PRCVGCYSRRSAHHPALPAFPTRRSSDLKVDYHPLAIPVPYYHSNVDSDEVMFYVGGDYEARKGSGIDIGSISLHPGGYAHGPQDRKSTRLNSSHVSISYAVFCLKKKKQH